MSYKNSCIKKEVAKSDDKNFDMLTATSYEVSAGV
jgi:hypothetical protein